MFDGNIIDDFMKNKFEAEQQLTLIEAEKAKDQIPLFLVIVLSKCLEFLVKRMFH